METIKKMVYISAVFATFGAFFTLLQLVGPVTFEAIGGYELATATDTVFSGSLFILVASLNFGLLWYIENEKE